MLSKKAKYAIKALLALADHEPGEPVRIADLAHEEQIPPKFLELILLELKHQGILQSRKGKGGGYLLARDPADIYLGQIVRMFDGPGVAYVRTYDVELAPSPSGSSSLAGVIRHVHAFGPVVRLELDLSEGGRTIEAHVPRARFEAMALSKGQRVYVSPTNVRVFAEPS